MIYLALLRGINVGGKNKIAMPALRDTFERLGFDSVTTYINSGNVVFSDDGGDDPAISRDIEAAIRRDFDLDIRIVLRDLPTVRGVIDALPETWVNDATTTANVLFLYREIDGPELLEQIVVRPEFDEVEYASGALLWRVDKAVLAKSGMMRLAGTPLYRQMTVRNVNTTRKVADIMNRLANG